MIRRMALKKDGTMSYCISSEENIGKGKCDHITHQKEGESVKEFTERASRISQKLSDTYTITISDLDKYIKENENNDDFDEKFKVYRAILDSGLPINLKGGFNIKAYNRIVGNIIQERPTKDIDINWYANLSENDCVKLIGKSLEDNGYNWEEKVLKDPNAHNRRIIVYDKNKNKVTQIDLCKSPLEDGNSISMSHMMKEKLNLKLNTTDRRFKDLVDTINIIQMVYPNGITKKDLLEAIDNKEELEKFNTRDVLIDNGIQSTKFKPNTLNNKSMESYYESFTNMIKGLLDNEIPNNSKFYYNGVWI